MPLIYVTGVAGSGKSTVLEELSRRGLEAHGIDEEGLADWVDRETGAVVPFPHDDPTVSIHDWYGKHRWVSSREHTGRLKAQADRTGGIVFLVGLAEDEDRVWDLFDRVIYLAVDEPTLRDRIESRQDNHFGKTADEMAVILRWLAKNDGRYRRSGASTVDAARPLPEVVEEVIRIASRPMTPPLSIQPEPPDGADARALLGALDAHLQPRYRPEDRHGPPVAALVQAVREGALIFLVARWDGAAAGCGAVRFVPGGPGGGQDEYAEIKRMYVAPEWRGRGVAQALLTALEGLARQHGYGVLRLETGVHQQEAIRLYERAGFSRCGLFGEYTNAAVSVLYEKALGPPDEGKDAGTE